MLNQKPPCNFFTQSPIFSMEDDDLPAKSRHLKECPFWPGVIGSVQ